MSQISLRRGMLNAAVGAGFALGALTCATTFAQAITVPMTGSFGIDVYHITQGSDGAIGDANQQAVAATVALYGSAIYSGTYTGDIKFTEPTGGTNQILAFLLSASGSLSGNTTPLLTDLSTANFRDTTLIVLTGNTGSTTLGGTITHDDGIGLYNPGLITPSADSKPTTAEGTNYSGLLGAWTLYYIESNGLPAVLDFEVSSQSAPNETPLPAAAWMFGSVLAGGAGVARWRKRRKAA